MAFALVCMSSSVFAQNEQRVRFKPGTTQIRLNGRLSPQKDEARYIVQAQAGRRLIVELTGPGPLSGEVVSPSGRREGQPGGGVFFDEKLSESGGYLIRISEGNRGEKRNVRFVLKIQLR